jgi:hypothetical protein
MPCVGSLLFPSSLENQYCSYINYEDARLFVMPLAGNHQEKGM